MALAPASQLHRASLVDERRALVEVRVVARAGRDAVVVGADGAVTVRVVSPALEGRANAAVCRLLAKRLGVAPSRVTVARGERSRSKLIAVAGVTREEVQRALGT